MIETGVSWLQQHHVVVRRELARFRGREVNTAGDGFLIAFDGPGRAIRCAMNRHGGFSAASRATGELKSKLSKRVAQLEQDLGVRLIERSTRSLQLTEIGRHVLTQCEIIAGGLEATEAIVARSRDEIRGSLRVSCPPQLPHVLGPGPMTTFLIRYPLVRVQLHLSNRRVDLINQWWRCAFEGVLTGAPPRT